jgi:DNA (cytosine-5)-methyltransferase 1
MPNRRQIHAADLFCGAGGTSAGLLDACEELNQTLHLTAINHWQVAVQTHRKNLPIAQHLCAELDQVNPMKVMKGKRLDLLVASPECTHHSVARGGRPINDQSRASAWVILKWIQELRIDNVLIENVKEFRDWGPLDYRGRPMKSRKGAIYVQFLNCLKACGYTVEDNILNCANYGDATTRERLFIMAKRGNKRISWPEATHSAAGGTDMYGHTMKKWRAAREIIDWERKGESIYSRKRPLKATTLARIYAGIDKFCGPLIAEAFLRDVSSQFPTTLVKEFLVILRRHGDARSIDEPIPTLCAGGNHVGVAQFVLQQQSGGVPRDVAEPLPTIATGGAISKVDAFVLSAGGPKVGAAPRRRPAQHRAHARPHGAGRVHHPAVLRPRREVRRRAARHAHHHQPRHRAGRVPAQHRPPRCGKPQVRSLEAHRHRDDEGAHLSWSSRSLSHSSASATARSRAAIDVDEPLPCAPQGAGALVEPSSPR